MAKKSCAGAVKNTEDVQLNVLPLVLKHWIMTEQNILRNNQSGYVRKHRELSSFPDPLFSNSR